MTGHDGQTVKEPLGRTVRFWQVKFHGVRAELSQGHRFAIQNQQVALRRMQFLVEIELEGKDHVVDGERSPIRKLDSSAELQHVAPSIGRNCPGLCKRRLRVLRLPIDMEQIRVHCADNLSRSRIDGKYRIQRLRFGAKSNDEISSRPPRLPLLHRILLRRSCREGGKTAGRCKENCRSKKQARSQTQSHALTMDVLFCNKAESR